jgi:hypothetical protein
MGVDPGREVTLIVASCVAAGGVCSGVTSLNVSVCDCDFSRTADTAGAVLFGMSGVAGAFVIADGALASAVGVAAESAQAITVSQDGRNITVVSSRSVCEVRVDSLRCLPDGVMYRSSIFSSS